MTTTRWRGAAAILFALLWPACAPAPVAPTMVITAVRSLPTAAVTFTPLTRSSATPPLTPALLPTESTAFAPTATLPANISPLTGTPADPARLALPPVAVKVSNAPPCVRPQHGLAQADIVFEHYVEAWVTRLSAIYHAHLPGQVGSVRSARLIDLELPAIFGAGFLYSGASAGVQSRLAQSDFAIRAIEAGSASPAMYRLPAESLPCNDRTHTLFADAAAAQTELAQRGYLAPVVALNGWRFGPAMAEGVAADWVAIDYLNAPAKWQYNANEGQYQRAQQGIAHTDAITGQTLSAANVVVLFAHHVYSDIQESTLWYSLEIQFWGDGKLLLFRDGQVYEGQWLRRQREGLFAIVDLNGDALSLRAGQTWFEFVGLDSRVIQTGSGWQIDPEELPLNPPPN